MRGGSGVIIVVLGLLVIYLGITGRYKCFSGFIACIGGSDCSCSDGVSSSTTNPTVTPLEPLAPIYPVR